MLLSSLGTMTCLPSGLNHAASGALKVCPAVRSPGRGNCHIFRPLGSMISTRLPPASEIRRGPGSTEGSEPGASQPGPEAVSAMATLVEVGATAGVDFEVVVVAPSGCTCDAITAGGFEGVAAAAKSHQDPTPMVAISATSSPRTNRPSYVDTGDSYGG